LLTILSVCVIAFGARNFCKFKDEITTYWTLIVFYFYSMISIALSVWLAWTNICAWNTTYWQTINALLRNSEICFSWSQSLAFLLVARNLWEVNSITKTNSSNFSAEKYNQFINKLLIVGLILVNTSLVFFMIFFHVKTADHQENKKFVKLEIASWLLGTFSALTLIFSTLYTSWVLRKLYGGDFSSTSAFMLIVLAFFCLAFTTRTVYEWVMYHYYLSLTNS